MTAVTFSFNLAPAQGSAASQSIPPSGSDAAIGRQYQAATAHMGAPSGPMSYADAGQGPGVTTLALGEEDGGAQTSSAPVQIESLPHSSPVGGGDGFTVTTLAIGEEDGGMSQAPVQSGVQTGGMSPIRDDHSIIGEYAKAARPEGSTYGSMQPIYSPGEAEYAAFAKASQGPEVLNFTPVPRVKPDSVNVSYTPPAGVSPAPVADAGNYISVGSYEAFISSGASASAAAPTAPIAPAVMKTFEAMPPAPAASAPLSVVPAPEMVHLGPLDSIMAAPAPAPAPEASASIPSPAEIPSAEPVIAPLETAPTAPVVPDPVVPEPAMPNPIMPDPIIIDPAIADPVMTEPVIAEPAMTQPAMAAPEIGATGPAAASAEVPETTVISEATAVEPEYVEVSLESYTPPSETIASPASPTAAAPATSVEKPVFEAYLAPVTDAPAAPTAPAAAQYSAPDMSAIPTSKPSLIASVSPPAMSPPSVSTAPPSMPAPVAESTPPAVSMGGSYVVFEGQGAGTADAPQAVTETAEAGSERISDGAQASDELRVTTMAIGEEDGLGGGTWQP